ncbi:rho guanine nucleotide exchange factor 5-like, partial [Mobula hypostoma]|uniref:rho guanine nucleotide exchange factor 5-like n=1 Tax=Mobula hypostoma TaxID=723540 RepID=UPI002FC323C2
IFPLVSQSRRLLKHGSLTEMEYTSSAHSRRKGTTRAVYLHLFNDCILLSRQRENGRFTVFDHSIAQNLVVENIRMKPSVEAKFLFRLCLQENHRGQYQEFVLRASSLSQKLRWISALLPMKEDIDLTQHYNSKQVQCLKPYKAREHDELHLQKADILVLTQECSDGWEEGYRLSDGDRGWFPSSHVEVITSRRSRLCNIEERLRLSHKSSRSSEH